MEERLPLNNYDAVQGGFQRATVIKYLACLLMMMLCMRGSLVVRKVVIKMVGRIICYKN